MNFEKCSDERLIVYYLQGNNAAFSIIVTRYQQSLFAYLYRFIYQRQTAEDLVQETFIKALLSLKSFDHTRLFRPWLYKIATHLALNKVRKQKKYRSNIEKVAVYNEKTPLNIVICEEENQRIESAICSLSPQHKMVFLLRVQQQFSYKEISIVMKCKEETARSRMFYAVEKLRRFLEEKP